MDRRLLFINHRPEVIKEFTFAMQQQDFILDTASSGFDAAVLIKKENYQVVILGMVLEGYNGNQILTYLNKNKPHTTCIVYTTTLTPGQLKFLVNERNVFRIFLRPVDYYMEFPQAIEAAFLEYALAEKAIQEKEELTDALREKRKKLYDICETIKRQRRGLSYAMEFLDYLLGISLKEKQMRLTDTEYKELFQAERELVRQYEQYRRMRFRNIETVEKYLKQEFSSEEREITFYVQEELSKLLPETFLRKLKIILWVILKRNLLLTGSYQMDIHLHREADKAITEIIMKLPKGLLLERSKVTAEAVRNNIVQCVVQNISNEYIRTEKEDCVKYYIEVDLHRKKLKKI